MARKIEVRLLDDTDGGKADETVQFALDGMGFEIDLSTKHAGELRAALEKYVSAGRRTGRVPSRSLSAAPTHHGAAPGQSRSDRDQNNAIREWARRKRIQLSNRGRIPRNIIEQYQAEGGMATRPFKTAVPAAQVDAGSRAVITGRPPGHTAQVPDGGDRPPLNGGQRAAAAKASKGPAAEPKKRAGVVVGPARGRGRTRTA